MQRRAVMVALLVLTVVLAGCNFGESETDVRGLPEADATETADSTPRPFDGAEPPPGVSASGVSDIDALLSAHASTMDGTSATVDVEFHLSVNGTGQNVSLSGKVVPDSDRGLMTVSFPDGTGTYYTEEGTTYYREIVNGSARYGTTGDVSAIPEQPRFGADQRVRTAIASAEWEPVGTVERDGRTLYEFTATSVEPPNVNTSDGTAVESSGRLLVDAQGGVHLVTVGTSVETDRGTVEYGIRVALTDVDSTTIERPEWYDNAA